MFHEPKTKEEAAKYRYGAWAGNPKGTAYDETKCAAEVWGGPRGFTAYQCTKKNGKGTGGLYCGTHAKKCKHDC